MPIVDSLDRLTPAITLFSILHAETRSVSLGNENNFDLESCSIQTHIDYQYDPYDFERSPGPEKSIVRIIFERCYSFKSKQTACPTFLDQPNRAK